MSRKFINGFPEKVDQYENLLDNNPIWKNRTQDVGGMPLEQMIELGITGPMIRGCRNEVGCS